MDRKPTNIQTIVNASVTKLNPYLTFSGTAAQAIELYKKVFKSEPTTVQKFKDMPPQEGVPMPSAAGGERIIHASFQIGIRWMINYH